MVIAAAFQAPDVPFADLLPMLVLVGGTCLLLLCGSLIRRWTVALGTSLTVVSAVVASIAAMVKWSDLGSEKPALAVAEAIVIDRLSVFVTIVICIVLALAALLVGSYMSREGEDGPEMHALLLTASLGGVVMGAANDLIVLFLGLEVLSLSLYLLAAANRRREQSQEAGLKYFVLGGFSSAFFLYGIALVFGATGTTNIARVSTALSTNVTVVGKDSLLLVGIGLMIVGLAFKVAAAPFQVWTPDVYEGAPSPVTAFMASAGKIAAFGAMLRVLLGGLESRVDDWRPVIWVLAILTVVVGSTLAIVQTNVKRMLAYSSVGHAGFILVGVEAAAHSGSDGVAASMTYLAIYATLVLGSFAVVMTVAGTGDGGSDLTDFKGLASRKPALALGFTVLLLAQAGVPLTSGFVAKFGVVKAAVDARSYAVAIVAMVAAVIGAYLYLRIMISMWLEEPATSDDLRVQRPVALVIALSVVFTLVVGIVPAVILDAGRLVSLIGG